MTWLRHEKLHCFISSDYSEEEERYRRWKKWVTPNLWTSQRQLVAGQKSVLLCCSRQKSTPGSIYPLEPKRHRFWLMWPGVSDTGLGMEKHPCRQVRVATFFLSLPLPSCPPPLDLVSVCILCLVLRIQWKIKSKFLCYRRLYAEKNIEVLLCL